LGYRFINPVTNLFTQDLAVSDPRLQFIVYEDMTDAKAGRAARPGRAKNLGF